MGAHNKPNLRVLVVDDTAVFRKILSDAIKVIDGLELVGTAPNGNIALQKLRLTETDLVLLDIFMPGMNGLETLKEIRNKFPKVNVIMISGATTRDAGITIEALENGAIEFIPKPKVSNYKEGMTIITEEIRRATQPLFKHEVKTHTTPPIVKPAAPIKQVSKKPATSGPFDIILIGVSTGGPRTLAKIIPELPADLACPVLIVQHMPPTFTASLADHLNKASKLTVQEASDNQEIEKGNVYIAPGGRHMGVRKSISKWMISLNDDPPENSCRPAVDVLFRSVSETLQVNTLAVILTGMGEDGAKGVEILKKKRCYCISQSGDSCVVFGMPQAIEKRNLSDEVIHCDRIAEKIVRLINKT